MKRLSRETNGDWTDVDTHDHDCEAYEPLEREDGLPDRIAGPSSPGLVDEYVLSYPRNDPEARPREVGVWAIRQNGRIRLFVADLPGGLGPAILYTCLCSIGGVSPSYRHTCGLALHELLERFAARVGAQLKSLEDRKCATDADQNARATMPRNEQARARSDIYRRPTDKSHGPDKT